MKYVSPSQNFLSLLSVVSYVSVEHACCFRSTLPCMSLSKFDSGANGLC